MGSHNEPITKRKTIQTIEPQGNLGNVKNKYILKIIIHKLQKKKFLEIIKYNKKVQNRLNIDINDYKKYCEEFSKIEIELIIAKNNYSSFINISEEDKPYYHIYFNDDKTEIKQYSVNDYDKVKKIEIIIDYQIKSLRRLFDGCNCIKSINFKKFLRENIIDMSFMFSDCKSLKYINLSNFNTSNVTNMCGMFYECSSLKELNLSNFNTKNVTDMSWMFSACTSLKYINLINFNTINVIKMNKMFSCCFPLKELNLSNFNTNNVTDMGEMFYGCSSLKELNLSNFNTNNVTNMNGMFLGCSSLKELNLSNFNFNKVINMTSMFFGCPEKLKKRIRAQYKNITGEAFVCSIE